MHVAKTKNKIFAMMAWASWGNINPPLYFLTFMTNSSKCGNRTSMITMKITHQRDSHQLPFAPKEVLTKIRALHWHHSRTALSHCLEVLTGHCAKDLEDLEMVNFHHLKLHPNLLVSLSHTREAAVAVMAKEGQNCLGIGVDIEKQGRLIKEEWKNKFLTESDKGESSLHLWCAKEAAFKASSYFWRKEKTFVLKDIIVQDENFSIQDLLQGKISYENHFGFIITKAWVTALNT